MSNKQYAWMRWGGGDAHGTFESYDAALAAAKDYCAGDGRVEITINRALEPNFFGHIPDADDLISQACKSFYDNHGWNGNDDAFELRGDEGEATRALHKALAAWAKTWVMLGVDWYMMEGEKIVLDNKEGDGP